MRVLICGDRNWRDAHAIYFRISELTTDIRARDLTVVQGEARGADTIAWVLLRASNRAL
jgi:hypothetical protein